MMSGCSWDWWVGTAGLRRTFVRLDPEIGQEQEQAFLDLKGALCKDSVLQSPDFGQHFTVQTDASGVGLGAVLLQGEVDNKKPVAYISRKLFPQETRYAAVELECLGSGHWIL